jgi:hypothetical protein
MLALSQPVSAPLHNYALYAGSYQPSVAGQLPAPDNQGNAHTPPTAQAAAAAGQHGAQRQAYLLATSGLMLHPQYKAQIWATLAQQGQWKDAAGKLGEDKRKFINRCGQRFVATGGVHYQKRRSSKHKPCTITTEEALLASKIVKAGRWIDVKDSKGNYIGHVFRHYPLVSRTVRHNSALRAIKDKYNLTCKQLLYHMKLADPKLRRHRIRMKRPVADDWLHRRMVRGQSLYNRCQTDPGWRERCHFVDECSVWIDEVALGGVSVWCGADDKTFHQAIHYNNAANSQPVKVRFIAVVNPKHGAVYLEFTTGTHDIVRLHNQVPNNPAHGPYRVSMLAWLLFANNNVIASSMQNPKTWQLLCQQLCICAGFIVVIECNSVRTTGQYNAGAGSSALYCCCKVLWALCSSQLLLVHVHNTHTFAH